MNRGRIVRITGDGLLVEFVTSISATSGSRRRPATRCRLGTEAASRTSYTEPTLMTRLYTFTISHFAEKARWSLDYKAIHYQEKRARLTFSHR